MVDSIKRPKLVGAFIRQRREAMGLSQRSLGLLFHPPVTTQFISNLERGVTPLPPNHVPTLTQALVIDGAELLTLLEKEYAIKLSGRMGRTESPDLASSSSSGPSGSGTHHLPVASADFTFMRSLYEAYRMADKKTKQAFATVCESILNLSSKPSAPIPGGAVAPLSEE